LATSQSGLKFWYNLPKRSFQAQVLKVVQGKKEIAIETITPVTAQEFEN